MRALHITDCHILGKEGTLLHGTDPFASLQAVLERALGLADPPSIILISGDLVEDGSLESYRRLKHLFAASHLPVYVVPGNHDCLECLREGFLGGLIQMGPLVDLEGWRIVLLNSQVVDRARPAHEPALGSSPCSPKAEAYGFLDASQLEIVSWALATSTGGILLTLHHSPISGCPFVGCQLRNAEELLALLSARSAPTAIISGHTHVALDRELHRVRLMTTPSTFAQVRHPREQESLEHADFWSCHSFDSSCYGFRIIDLGPDGRLESQIHWVRASEAPIG
jgi:Icc protein